jgi:hypothetical protein
MDAREFFGNEYKCALRRKDQTMTTGIDERRRQGRFSKKFSDVMSARNIEDITLKMQAIRKVPQDALTRTFVEMCDAGINIYIQEQKKRYPDKSDREIMRAYHLARIKTA